MSRGARQVPLTRRLLAARPLRTTAGALGIGLALMLMLLLNGLWAGAQRTMTDYEDQLAADLVVVPPDTGSLFSASRVLPAATVTAVRATPGVTRAAPVRTLPLILELAHGKAAVAAVASQPGAPGGPWRFSSGRAPGAVDEVAVDDLFAEQHGLSLGDRLPMLGHPMRVVGLTGGTARFMTPLVFTTNRAMTRMLRAEGTVGAVLVASRRPDQTAERLRDLGLTVRTPTQLREESLELATKIFGSPVRLAVGVAFAAGTLIVALVAYTRVTEQQRDLGVLKALGAGPGRIRRVAVAETFALTAAGALAAVVLLLAAREVLAWWRPAFPVDVTAATLASTGAAAVAMALLGAWLPARRLARLDAASAFRSAR